MKKVGVLALQGGVEEHLHMLDEMDGVEAMSVLYERQLHEIDGLIIPGGESTTLGKLLKSFNMLDSLIEKIEKGLPVWGTCAGMILLAKEIEEEDTKHLAVMNIKVRRNAYGRQLGSFDTKEVIKEVDDEAIPLVFIRAPYVSEIGGNIEVLLEIDGHIVACKERNMLATAFHPELTKDIRFHKYFVEHFLS